MSGSAHTAPATCNTPRGSHGGTRRTGTSAAELSSMKSRLPDQPVAITGLPSSMASAAISPNPSLRCSVRTISAVFISARRSPGDIVRVSIRTFGRSATAAVSVAKSSGKWSALMTFTSSIRSRLLPKAARKAVTAASGFLRTNDEARLNATSTITVSSGNPKAARSMWDRGCASAASGGRTTRTRPGSSGSSAAAVNAEGTQSSCTNGRPACQSGGTTGSSQAQ